MTFDEFLPVVFMALMGVAMLLYVISDGYDLGVGMLLPRADDAEKDVLIASIGPFWDANETWLVLGIGILLVAFPKAHGLVLGELYLPVALMLVGLTLRGVAFDFRVKAKADHKAMWDRMFFAGSTLAAVAQGWMLGRYVSGFGEGWNYPVFAAAIAAALPMAYVLLGAAWLIMKTEGDLQQKAIHWAKLAWGPMVVGLALISLATPWISATVRERWFTLPAVIALMAIPLVTVVALLTVRRLLDTRMVRGPLCWLPFVLLIGVFVLGFLGLAYSLYPYVVIDRLTIWQAASSPAALKVILIGVCISVPAIAA
jgi:cytochrome d ubiquinol oxidase subunit II